jgi:hypothetical protein
LRKFNCTFSIATFFLRNGGSTVHGNRTEVDRGGARTYLYVSGLRRNTGIRARYARGPGTRIAAQDLARVEARKCETERGDFPRVLPVVAAAPAKSPTVVGLPSRTPKARLKCGSTLRPIRPPPQPQTRTLTSSHRVRPKKVCCPAVSGLRGSWGCLIRGARRRLVRRAGPKLPHPR